MRFAHVLWSPASGPLVAYWDPSLAYAHARTMAGVNVDACEIKGADRGVHYDRMFVVWSVHLGPLVAYIDQVQMVNGTLSTCELRTCLPTIARDDMNSDFDGDDDTPEVTSLLIDDLDDG